jgi:uncharacterized membrane protein
VTKEKTYKLIAAFAVFGIILATYLYASYLAQPTFRPCTVSAQINCDAVIEGEISKTWGIPTALYGLIGYFVILVAALTKKGKLAFGMALFGTLFCLRLTYIEIFDLQVICPVCLMCQITMLVILGLTSYLLFGKNKTNTPTEQPAV